eukprot:gene22006-28097_t
MSTTKHIIATNKRIQSNPSVVRTRGDSNLSDNEVSTFSESSVGVSALSKIAVTVDVLGNPSEHIEAVLKALKSLVVFETSFDIPSNGVLISDAFDPFLGPYVQIERQELDKIMSTALSEDTMASVGQVGEPFESINKVFDFIKFSLKRCAGLSKGHTYLSLTNEFRECLFLYSEKLKGRCAGPAFRSQVSVKIDHNSPAARQQSKLFESTLCRVIRTAEYCIDTLPALESSVKSRIKPVLVKGVDFSTQIDGLNDLVSHAMSVLVSGVIARMDEDLRTMRHMSWGSLDSVGDVSPHVKKFVSTLSESVLSTRAALTSVYFNNFCVKLATSFLDAFQANLKLLKRICTTGGGQLLVDLSGLKEFLLKMPNIRLPEGTDPVVISKVYLSVVNAKVKKIEVILKLVCTEDNKLEEMFAVLWPDGTASDLDSVRSMRSVRNLLPVPLPLDQVHDVTKFGKRAANNASDSVNRSLKTGFNRVDSGVRGVVSDLSQLLDTSTHSSHSSDSDRQSGGSKKHEPTSSSAATSKPLSDTASRVVGDMKHAWSDAISFVKYGGGVSAGSGRGKQQSSSASGAPSKK